MLLIWQLEFEIRLGGGEQGVAVGFGGLEEPADVALDEVVVVAENQVVAAVEAGEQVGDVLEVV